MREVLRRLWYLLRQQQADAELVEELAFHRDMKERELEAAGTPANRVGLDARRALGSTALAHDQARDVWVPGWLQGVGQDFRLAGRKLVQTPVVTGVAMLSLALGIGANTAIFSLIDGLLLRSLPVRQPDRLVLVTADAPGVNVYWSADVWREIERRELFDGTVAWADTRFNLAPGGEAQYVDGLWVSGSYFAVLGVPPLLGRTIAAADDVPGGGSDGPVAMISYDFWRRQFSSQPDVIGRTLIIDRIAFTIVGVTPPGFFGANVGHAFDVVAPLPEETLTSVHGSRQTPGGPQVSIMARLRSEDTIDSATARLRGVQPQIRQATLPQGWPPAFLANYLKAAFTLQPTGTGLSTLRRRFSRPLGAIMIVVALVLLVACTNLANLALARAAARRQDLRVRVALGASRWRLTRQLLAESIVLAGVGAAGGLLVATWAARLLVRQLSTTVFQRGPQPTTGTVFLNVSLDGRVLAFTAVLTVTTVILFGLLPAVRASRVAPLDAIIQRTSGTWRRRGGGPADLLIVMQAAISIIVVVAAGLFTRTLFALETRPLGFDRDGVLVATIDAQYAPVQPDRRQALYRDVLDAVEAVPGVSRAGLSSIPPISTGPTLGQPIKAISGEPALPPRGALSALNLISPAWFRTMGIPLDMGRDIGHEDRLDTPPVAVVNEMFARTFLHGANPLGRTITLFLPGPPPPPVEIVGVVADSVYGGLRSQIAPTMYLAIAQRDAVWWPFLTSVNLSFRAAAGDPEPLRKSVAAAVATVNPDLALTFHSLSDYTNDSLSQERLLALLAGAFAVLALLLAGLGLYGVTAYAVAGRRAEIGIRLALGAPPGSIQVLVLRRVLGLVAVGIIVGAGVSLWTSTFVATLLYGLEPRDSVTLSAAAAVLAAVAFLSGWLPARHAMRIDPAVVMRCN